ncbi:hypothetical protein BJ322DRAFT_1064620 [Thelephora terrestris]|uniref:Uncharacterized protein n=1 Tax=Thelephora terrestris TaxID=56493 RepID=A0A9P6HCX1_9AGAM|nr:hypothetical protein BJ322DRAFT_1064620 [Thelephora terrestris]
MKWTRTGSLPRTAAGLCISIGLWDMMHDGVLTEVLSSSLSLDCVKKLFITYNAILERSRTSEVDLAPLITRRGAWKCLPAYPSFHPPPSPTSYALCGSFTTVGKPTSYFSAGT